MLYRECSNKVEENFNRMIHSELRICHQSRKTVVKKEKLVMNVRGKIREQEKEALELFQVIRR